MTTPIFMPYYSTFALYLKLLIMLCTVCNSVVAFMTSFVTLIIYTHFLLCLLSFDNGMMVNHGKVSAV